MSVATEAAWEALGQAGFVVSVAYGPCGGAAAWTVTVLARDGRTQFLRPYKATSFAHAIAIAGREIQARGWDNA